MPESVLLGFLGARSSFILLPGGGWVFFLPLLSIKDGENGQQGLQWGSWDWSGLFLSVIQSLHPQVKGQTCPGGFLPFQTLLICDPFPQLFRSDTP